MRQRRTDKPVKGNELENHLDASVIPTMGGTFRSDKECRIVTPLAEEIKKDIRKSVGSQNSKKSKH